MTNSAQFSQITDELLSAYLDQAVTAEEKRLVEAAVAAEPEIAWRLETLRQTVQLLRALPAVALPRSFVLSEAQVAASPEPVAAGLVRSGPVSVRPAVPELTGWQGWLKQWRTFWQGGSPLLRNAMAASFVLLVVLLTADNLLRSGQPNLAPSAAPELVKVVGTTQLPTAIALAVPPSEPAPQASEPTVDVTPGEVMGTASPTNNPANSDRESQVAVLGQGNAAPPPETYGNGGRPGEDQGVTLDPAGPPAGPAESQGGGGEDRLRLDQTAMAAQTQAKQATTEVVTSAALVSPLATPAVALPATAEAITATAVLSITGAVTVVPTLASPLAYQSALTSTGATTVTTEDWSLPPTVNQPNPSQAAAQGEPAQTAAAPWDRIRLLQLISALVTVVLAGLWWRSRHELPRGPVQQGG